MLPRPRMHLTGTLGAPHLEVEEMVSGLMAGIALTFAAPLLPMAALRAA